MQREYINFTISRFLFRDFPCFPKQLNVVPNIIRPQNLTWKGPLGSHSHFYGAQHEMQPVLEVVFQNEPNSQYELTITTLMKITSLYLGK